MVVPQRLALVSGAFLFSVLPTLAPINSKLEPLAIQAAKANGTNSYTPPLGTKRVQRTEGAGSRGDCKVPVSLSLLAPKDHVAQTVVGHPTFLWYISAPTAPIRFTLVEPHVAEPIVDRFIKIDKPGIFKLSVPETSPELAANKDYRWTVSVICNPDRPSENIYAYANIVRVPLSPDLAQKLATASTESSRAQIYAQSGAWYEAIASIHKAYEDAPYSMLTSEYFFGLLNEVGLTKVATEVRQPLAQQR